MAKGDRPTRAELEEDRFVEWIMRVGDVLREHMQVVVGAVAVLVATILLVGYVRASQEEDRLQASAVLGDVLMADGNGNAVDAVQIAERLIRDHPGTPAAAQGGLFLANRYFHQGRLSEAQRLYETYLDEHGDSEVLVFAAWSGVAACLESQGQFAKAAQKYELYADRHKGQQASLALMDASRCYALAGDTTSQKKALRRIRHEFPNSPLASKAHEQLRTL